MILITAQRLARKLCSCKKPQEIPEEALLRAGFKADDLDGTWQPFGPAGCEHTRQASRRPLRVRDVLEDREAHDGVEARGGEVAVAQEIGRSEGGLAQGSHQRFEPAGEDEIGPGVLRILAGERGDEHAASDADLQHPPAVGRQQVEAHLQAVAVQPADPRVIVVGQGIVRVVGPEDAFRRELETHPPDSHGAPPAPSRSSVVRLSPPVGSET